MTAKPLTILHTSDWHLGRTLYGRKRYDEYESFLNWLLTVLAEEGVDLLLVAGDVFDSAAPSNRAQQLYYRFLVKAARGRQVAVVAGNHDSPSFLNAPKELMMALDIHVTGLPGAKVEDEVRLVTCPSGGPGLILCAVPFLRDQDIRTAQAGESLADKDQKLIEGIKNHYAQAAEAALALRRATAGGERLPIVATGHLFAAGGVTTEGDGVRELYVGTLNRVPGAYFPQAIDYLALGHLHLPQKVGGLETRRYSGAPLAMSFEEAGHDKTVTLIKFEGLKPQVTQIKVPRFRQLVSLKGDWPHLAARLAELAKDGPAGVWAEIIYDGQEVMGDLKDKILTATQDSDLEILRIKNNRLRAVNGAIDDQNLESLGDLSVSEVFERCLLANQVQPGQWPELKAAHDQAVEALRQGDPGDR